MIASSGRVNMKGKLGSAILTSIVFALFISATYSLSFYIQNSEVTFPEKGIVSQILLFLMVAALNFICSFVIRTDEMHGESFYKFFSLSLFSLFITLAICLIFEAFFGKYTRPIVLAGILVAILVNKRAAFLIHIELCLIVMVYDAFFYGLTSYIVIPTLISEIAGILFIIMISQDDTRVKSVVTTLKAVPIYVAVFLCFFFIFKPEDVFLNQQLIQIILSPVFAGLLHLGLLPVFESLFNIVTAYRLTELTDITKGLLQAMSIQAPGTFNHSLSVANLAGACASVIGEDPRLARACGYYHDIGKITDPIVFKENQTADDQNPHDKITPELSINLIKKHVTNGAEMLKRAKMPDEFVQAAIEHHGTLPIKYFYYKAKKFTDGYLNIEDYSYDGPIPSTKISAIIMIVDACEAAVRTIPDRTREKVDNVVRDIIEERMELEQFNNCAITFRDLQKIRITLVDNFVGIYHERIEYPKFKVMRDEKRDEKE